MKIFLSLFIFFTSICHSQTNSKQRIIDQTPYKGGYFGDSGDIEGDYAVIAGLRTDYFGRGVANIYKRDDKGFWNFTRAMSPNIKNREDRFGQNACAMSGNYVIVGDWMNTDKKYGAAHIFKFWGDTAWSQVAYLFPKDTIGIQPSNFGKTVDIFGKYAFVGADNSVYIYELQTNDTWKQIKKISRLGVQGFGNNVAVYEDYLIISAEWESINGTENSGAVYVYFNDKKAGWKFKQKITLSELLPKAEFGSSVAIYKNQLLIGYPKAKMGEISAGNVYLYENKGGEFELIQKLYAEDFSFNKYRFGEQVSITENFIAIGEAQGINHEGSVYVFEKNDSSYIQKIKFSSPVNTNYGSDFGQNVVVIDNNSLLVGAPGDNFCNKKDEASNSKCGSAYMYQLEKTVLSKEAKLYMPYGMSQKLMEKKMKQYNADSILFDNINQDDVYTLRDKETGLWGMFQSGKQLIPMKYQHINFSGWNDPFTFALKDNKWCIIYGMFGDEEYVNHCGYEELKKYRNQGYLYVAGKINGTWSWVNWYNGSSTNSNKKYHQELSIFDNWNPGNYDNFKLK